MELVFESEPVHAEVELNGTLFYLRMHVMNFSDPVSNQSETAPEDVLVDVGKGEAEIAIEPKGIDFFRNL